MVADTVFDGKMTGIYPGIPERISSIDSARTEIRVAIHDPGKPGVANRRLASIMNEAKLRRVLATMLDEKEFLSPFGIRSVSRYHADHPYVFWAGDQEFRVSYLPAESDTGMFG